MRSPWPKNAKVGVPRILQILKAEKLPATFFIPGWVVEKYPAESKMIRDAGYEIGHHGYLHERATPDNPDGERLAFEQGMRALDTVLGVKPAGYRAPAWDLTPITLDCVKQHGMMSRSS
jgi:peptidoglycan/xylan/chitin deacetylase (PgdA/CDA1 family)